ncbi:hypothetical protein AAHC03_05746 [Spirometra sp. Aus1]
MAARTQRQYFNPEVLFQFKDIEKPVQSHLKNVYSLLSVGLIVATVGAALYTLSPVVQSWAFSLMLLSTVTSIGSLLHIYMTEHNRENLRNRIISFLLFTFSSGLGLGPLVHFASTFNPSTIPAAFLGTALIFVSFTIASLMTRKRYFIYLGGILATALGVMTTFGLMNIFLRSEALFHVELYLGFAVFCLFIVYDTQMIVFKRQNGEDDFVKHAIDLFVDVVEVFRHLLIILNSKRERNERRE